MRTQKVGTAVLLGVKVFFWARGRLLLDVLCPKAEEKRGFRLLYKVQGTEIRIPVVRLVTFVGPFDPDELKDTPLKCVSPI